MAPAAAAAVASEVLLVLFGVVGDRLGFPGRRVRRRRFTSAASVEGLGLGSGRLGPGIRVEGLGMRGLGLEKGFKVKGFTTVDRIKRNLINFIFQ
jgi:hypothetical protein